MLDVLIVFSAFARNGNNTLMASNTEVLSNTCPPHRQWLPLTALPTRPFGARGAQYVRRTVYSTESRESAEAMGPPPYTR